MNDLREKIAKICKQMHFEGKLKIESIPEEPTQEDFLKGMVQDEIREKLDPIIPYRVRLSGEYTELCMRIGKLSDFIDNYNKTKTPKLTCPVELLIQQLAAMQTYATILKQRLAYEGITD